MSVPSIGQAQAAQPPSPDWGALLAAASPWLGELFTSDSAVTDRLLPVLLVAAIAMLAALLSFSEISRVGDHPGHRGRRHRGRIAG